VQKSLFWQERVMQPDFRNHDVRTHGAARRLAPLVAFCIGFCATAQADPGDALDTGGGGIARRFDADARTALEQGHVTAAINDCDRALKLYPNYIRAHFDRGRALLAGGQNDAAILEFSTVIAAHPEYPMVYDYRGEAYLRAHKPMQAIQEFNRAMTAATGIGSRRAADVFAERSLAFEMLGQGGPALQDFQAAVADVSGDLRDYVMFDDSCYNAAVVGLLEAAITSCDESISRHSRNMDAYASRGLAELKSGLFDKAIADYTQALYYRTELATALYGRGLAKRARGDSAGAATDITAAEASEPDIANIMTRLGVRVATPSPAR